MSLFVACECGHSFETPEENTGLRVPCPACGRGLIVPKPAPPSELLSLPEESSSLSGKAVESLALGVLFFFACFTGIPAIFIGLLALIDIDRSRGRLRGRGIAIAGIVLGVIGCLFTFVFLVPWPTRCDWPRSRSYACQNNLKQIGIALNNYLQANGVFPAAAITDKNGKPLLSWRVAILPYLEQNNLYAKFRLDEPWDSPHNLALLPERPGIYACPADIPLDHESTGYLAVIGANTAFTPDFRPVPIREFTDGTSRTLLVGDSRHKVPWTKPEDLPFDMAIPLSGLGSHHDDGFNAVFADASVRFLKSSISPSALKEILTRNGGEGGPQDPY